MSKLLTHSMVFIVIILISAFILLLFEGNLKKAYADITAKQTCKASVATHAALKLRYADFSVADFSGEIKCPTIKLEIKDNKENIVKRKLADAMYDCWDQFWRGDKELFADDSIYCKPCHRISLDKEIKISGFSDYLATHNAPGQKMSYLQFLTTEKTQNSEFLEEYSNKEIADTIDASKNSEYAIIFTYVKGKKYVEEYAKKATYASPGVGIIALGFGVFKLGGIVGGALSAIATPAVGVPVGGTISSAGALTMGFGALWSYLAIKFVDIPFEHIATVSLIPYDAENLKNLNCKEIPIK